MKSLRRRLLVWLLPATLLSGIFASAATYWGALSELDELLNDQLKVIARHVVVDSTGRLSLEGVRPGEADRLSGQLSHGVLLQVWRGNSIVFSSDPDASLPPPRALGSIKLQASGQEWRTYVSKDGDTIIRVGQVQRARWDAIAEIALHLFWPVLSLIPVLALSVWFGIGYGLRPLRDIVVSLRRRDANNMHSINTKGMPAEVAPLVDALNDLLARLHQAFTTQKHFIADAAHELRTPIMGLGLQAELLPKAANDRERDLIVNQLRTGTARLSHLAEQLLTLARLGPEARVEMSALDLNALCKSVVVDRARMATAQGIDLGLVAEEHVSVSGDTENLRILLNNLVDNAIRYAGAGARVDIVVRREGQAPIAEVKDDGPGIPASEKPMIWDRFYRGSGHSVTGSGLGMSIVKRIAEQHGAEVFLAEGLGGRGLTVGLRFPSSTLRTN